MDIPRWFVWIALGLVFLQTLGLVPVVRRLRGSDSSTRFQACLDLVDAVGSLLLLGGILLSLAVAESWFWLVLVGFALVTAVYIAKGIHWLHTRRRSTI